MLPRRGPAKSRLMITVSELAADRAAALQKADLFCRSSPSGWMPEQPGQRWSAQQPGPAANGIELLLQKKINQLFRFELLPVSAAKHGRPVQPGGGGTVRVDRCGSRQPQASPMLIYAAGTIRPAMLVIGAGVAGLHIATASWCHGVGHDASGDRLEQRSNLGAKSMACRRLRLRPRTHRRRVGASRPRAWQAIGALFITTTAKDPGRKAPQIVTADMVIARAYSRPRWWWIWVAETGGQCGR